MHEQIRKEMIEALKAKEELRLSVLRGLIAAFTNELVANKKKPDERLSDSGVLAVIKRAVKQRQDSIEQYTKGNRPELANKESEELKILKTYLPETMGKAEIEKIAKAKKEELGIDDESKMGMLMGAVIKETKGEADGSDVKDVVEALF